MNLRMLDQCQMMNHSQLMSMGQPMSVLSQSQQVMNNQNSQMMINSQLINPSHMMMNRSQWLNNRFGGHTKPRNNRNWKMKKGNNNNRNELSVSINNGGNLTNVSGAGGYYAPTLNELHQQNRLKARRHISKKKFNHSGSKSAPFAPRNTTSYLIRAKKAGGITSLVSPCPVTPAVLPTPIFSPCCEVLVDMAKEEWGVDGYGSMKGLIRLRSPGNDEECGSSESDVEEHLEVERRLDHDLSRFEMIYPNYGGFDHSSYVLENRVDDQDTHIAQLEEENLMLKDRLFLMEREFNNLRTRLQCLEMQIVENDFENESASRGYGRSIEDHKGLLEENSVDNKESNNGDVAADVYMEDGNHKIEENTNDVMKDDHVNGIAEKIDRGVDQ